MNSRKVRSREHVVGRVAVNAVRTFFESHGQVYHEVDQANDYGKDAYVDLVVDDNVTGKVIALQVKGGLSYKSRSGYFIPYNAADKTLWAESSVPVFGVVVDVENSHLLWVNLSEQVSEPKATKSGRVAVTEQLDGQTWGNFLDVALRESRGRGSGLLGLHSDDPVHQGSAVWDALAVGRFDARALIMLRRVLPYLHEDNLPDAVYVLAHCVRFHPDIFWNGENAVASSVKAAVCRTFNWSTDDVIALLRVVDDENMFTRGSIGEHVYLLLSEGWGPDVFDLFVRTLAESAQAQDEASAYKAAVLLQYQAGEDARSVLEWVMGRHPELRAISKINDLVAAVRAAGWLDIA